ncbi:MAG: hypothetical protein QGG64_27470 [Candidatus Latescibacteria bacterium]|jgi:hypothetical protein|nr:hypothetical protein [Candidatus Latescibacterota bacterium]
MRVIVVGCEYSGVSTLINGIFEWGKERGIHHHLDDHFTIPDAFHLTEEEQQGMHDMLPAIKERFQRFQIVYHVHLLHKYEHILMGGFHIEEMVYGPRYYYPGKNIQIRGYEPDMPEDTILVHLYARAEVIRERMAANLHPHSLVPSEDVPEVLDHFADEFRQSWIGRKFAIDTSDLSPEKLLETFLKESVPHLNSSDGNTRILNGS